MAVLFLVALSAFVYFAYQRGIAVGEQNMREKAAVTPTPKEESSTTPTPAEKQANAYSIIIENGSGISGQAGKVKTMLEKDDYNITSVGNADTSDYEETVIKAKENVDIAWLTTLKEKLKAVYTVSEDTKKLADDNSSDVIIIVGSKKQE